MKKTFLYEEHVKAGAKFTEFGGWDMPVQYTSVIDEHNAVRNNVGVFDTSHMGTFIIKGDGAEAFLNKVTLGNMINLPDKKARYSMILNEEGGIKDDIIVYNFGDEYMMIVNAGNLDKDWLWLNSHRSDDIILINKNPEISLLAVQGPRSQEIIQSISETDIVSMKYFTCQHLKLKDIEAEFCRIARTGYTGEDGFEIFISNNKVKELWGKLLKLNVKPCGLGCRDTLRLESGMPLHGHEIDENINPIDSGFEKLIKWENDFIGKDKLIPLKDNPSRKIIAFESPQGIARNGNPVYYNDKNIGYVTSGSFSPTLKKAIGMALIDASVDAMEIEAEIHNKRRILKVVSKPFYKRAK